ncbi:MAG: Cysteine--tRNA ligase [Alphaproteobacteria bacterium ADurb.Bin438]|nr:MAG: Cysteine--tRNA ligase [Alphaproteobacteria bacterium ADurb.Bin438]
MTITFYNTLSSKKEEFLPINPENVRMYVCGPTVYDRAHVGNARSAVVFDSLYRFLKEVFPKVTFARNFTDVDDKIINKHKQTGKPITEITEETIQWFHEDMDTLNVLRPDFEPRATETIPEMIELVKDLVDKGFAYEAEGHVLFDVTKFQGYGVLSKRSMEDMIEGARVEVAPYKKNPADFVLWKPSNEGEVGWDSPFGYGRPGWHLECSAMSKKYLGESFDIHGGGQDLIFPHHENEIAQSYCACGCDAKHHKYANYWVHNGMLMVDGKKMSKSLGNFYSIRDIINKYPGEVIRFFMLSTHYHQPLNFTFEGLDNAKTVMNKFYNALLNIKGEVKQEQAPSEFIEALSDDLNTPKAIAILHELFNNLNKEQSLEAKSKFVNSARVLGLLLQDAETWFKGDVDNEGEIVALIGERNDAKKNKDYKKADEIRAKLFEMGIIIEDTKEGVKWKKA